MKTAIIGYPRIGKNRELKFRTENYFNENISTEALESTAKELRSVHWDCLVGVLKDKGFKTQVGPGVYDIHSPRIPGEDEIKGTIKNMLEYIRFEKLWTNPDCELKTRGEAETIPSLKNLVNATHCVRSKLEDHSEH